jgi:hypothetical protein
MPKFPKDKLVDAKPHYSLPTNQVSVRPPVKEIKIELHWRDTVGYTIKGFDDVRHFADFLRDNPDLAKAIGYISKKQN